METNELFISRDIVIVEDRFPFMHKISNEQGKTGNNAIEDYLAKEDMEPCHKRPEQVKGDEHNQDVIELENNAQEQDIIEAKGGGGGGGGGGVTEAD